MSLYNIAFDTNNRTECLNHFSIEKKKGFIFESVNHCEIRPIGSILLDFLNIDIENGEDMVNFIANYCLEDLLFKLAKKSELNISKYYKNDKNHQRNVVSTGLGLSIVKEILELHGYEYGVKSVLKKGSTFYFKIKI